MPIFIFELGNSWDLLVYDLGLEFEGNTMCHDVELSYLAHTDTDCRSTISLSGR